jgi:hypothetical protein
MKRLHISEKIATVIENEIVARMKAGEEIDYLALAETHQVDAMHVFAVAKRKNMEHAIPTYNMAL